MINISARKYISHLIRHLYELNIKFVAFLISSEQIKYKNLLVSRALSEGGLQLLSDGFVLLLLASEFVLQSVNLNIVV